MAVTKDAAMHYLSNAQSQQCFWCCNGAVIANLSDLALALQNMSTDTFTYHANAEKNDFGNWVQDVVGDAELAQGLRKSKDHRAAAKRVAQRVNQLKRIAGL